MMGQRGRRAAENARQYRVIDQSLSSYATLQDECDCRARLLNMTQVVVSLFLCAFAFMGDDVIASLGYEPTIARFVIAVIAVFIFSLSIIEYIVDWKQQAGRYGDAAERLASLKMQYRRTFSEGAHEPAVYGSLTEEYNNVMATLPRIPERSFVRLKAAHQFKRLLSQRISDNPKAPRWFLRLQLRFEGIHRAIQEDSQEDRQTAIAVPKKEQEALSGEDSRNIPGGESS